VKVLIVNTSDLSGGAARAAYRLHQSLLKQGVDSQMLVQYKFSNDTKVHYTNSKMRRLFNKLRPVIDRLPIRNYKTGGRVSFSAAWTPFSDVVKVINQINPDIVHLHWINAGMVKIEDLPHIKSPIVWSLHDMWAFTGGCHYDEECGGYKKTCGNCKVLRSSVEQDISRKVFNRKQKAFSKLNNLTIVGLSHWLEKCAQDSTLFKDKKVVNLPNPIDTDKFRPFEKSAARDLWNLPKDKKLVLFGAVSALDDSRKGSDYLRAALSIIECDNIELVIFGSTKPDEPQDFGFETHYVGNLQDDMSLVALYSAADVMVVPSKQENLSNAIVESLSCGTPVVGFDIGGNSDMIDHKQNGYLAEPFSTSDLACGIEWILDAEDNNKLGENARSKVMTCFDSSVVAEKYINLYKNIL